MCRFAIRSCEIDGSHHRDAAIAFEELVKRELLDKGGLFYLKLPGVDIARLCKLAWVDEGQALAVVKE